MNRAFSMLQIKEYDDEKRVIRGIATTPTVDRMGDSVDPMGAKFKTPMPLLLNHDAKLPVGSVTFAKSTKSGIPFEATLPNVRESGVIKDRVDEAWHSLKYGLIGAVSIGFRAVEDGVERLKNGGLLFKEWEWMELSLVAIPANPDAVITGMKSFDTEVRAALGKKDGSVTKTGGVTPNPYRTKGTPMKTIAELRELRANKSARMEELVNGFKDADHNTTDEEQTEFDSLDLEVKALDKEIRIASFDQTKAAGATRVDGSNSQNGSNSRSPTIFVRNADPEDKFKGQSYTRMLIAKAAAFAAIKNGNFVSPVDVARHRWGKTHPKLVEYIRAGVAAGGTGSGDWGAELAQSDTRFTGDFIEFLYSKTVFDSLPLRSVPGRVHIKGQDGAATGYWVGENKAIPVSKPDFSDVELNPLKVAALAVCSKELVMDSSPSAEMLIRDSIVEASAQRVDTTFLSTAAAASGVSPAGLLNGLSALAPSGTDAAAVRADYQSLIADFLTDKNAGGLVHVMTPSMAVAMSLLVNALGQTEFPAINESGGTLFGRPVYTGDNVTSGNWIVLKPSDIWKIGDMGIEVSMSDTATIEQDNAPAGAGDVPTAASATLMSLWQTEQMGFKVVRRINYAKRRSGAVKYLADGEYGGVFS